MARFVALVLLAFAFGCKSEADMLREEGYTNVHEMAPLVPCPIMDPNMDSSFVADMHDKTWEIKRCCHREPYQSICAVGHICFDEDNCMTTYAPCTEWRTVCSRYVRALDAEGS